MHRSVGVVLIRELEVLAILKEGAKMSYGGRGGGKKL